VDIHQLKTFAAVAKEGTITRAAERVHLSQPAVSAHIKALEDTLGLTLFDRTPKGMTLTRDGERLLEKAERALAAHQALVDEAARIKGKLSGRLRLGAGSNSNHAAVGRLVTAFAERWPEVDVALEHATTLEILARLKAGTLDAGFCNLGSPPGPDVAAIELGRFTIHVAAPAGHGPLDWKALGAQTWIYPTVSSCCADTAKRLFAAHGLEPKRIVSVDRGDLTRTLIAAGVGVGLLHDDVAKDAQRHGEVELLYECPEPVSVVFAYLKARAEEPLLAAAATVLR
jgi:DNA-binding transcriptional LysR family regulator